MNNIFRIFVILSVVLTLSSTSFSEDLGEKKEFTLAECFALALKRSETIAINEETIKEARARFTQALSTILPRVSYEVDKQFQDGGDKTREQRFTFSQPLFSGFKEFASMSASRSEQRLREFELKRAKEILFLDVADAFYLFLSFQDDITALETINGSLIERTKELDEREQLGRSRLSELVSAQAQLSRNEAEIQDVLTELEIIRQLLEFLIGREVRNVIDEQSDAIVLENIDGYLLRADMRADVLAFYESWQVAEKNVAIVGADRWPHLSANGNYYTQKDGPQEDVDWDVGLSLSLPLFTGGEITGAVAEARILAKKEEIRYQQAHRQAQLDIKNAYTRLSMSIKKTQAYLKAYEATRRNYELQIEDYRRSLVNNLEVLQALEDLQDSQRDYFSSRDETKRFYWNFKAALGEIL